MQIRTTATTYVKTVQECLSFIALMHPVPLHSCIRGFCRHFLLIACGNTTWKLSSLGTPATSCHLQAVLDLPLPSLQTAENQPARSSA